jgi:hypothetical protein
MLFLLWVNGVVGFGSHRSFLAVALTDAGSVGSTAALDRSASRPYYPGFLQCYSFIAGRLQPIRIFCRRQRTFHPCGNKSQAICNCGRHELVYNIRRRFWTSRSSPKSVAPGSDTMSWLMSRFLHHVLTLFDRFGVLVRWLGPLGSVAAQFSLLPGSIGGE